MVFYLSMEIKATFSFNISEKLVNTSLIIINYLIVLASTALFMLLFYQCKKLVKYFIENSKT